MRLDDYLTKACFTDGASTLVSRKEAKRAIGKGQVTVNGELCRKAAHAVAPDDQVTLDAAVLHLPGERYLMLNKPEGVVSATVDGLNETVLDLIAPGFREGLHVVGRLDRDTTGLILLTTDGQWSHRITSPRHEHSKTYRVSLAEPLSESACEQLRQGVKLKSDRSLTAPAQVTRISEQEIDLTLTEGRYHQVRRMLAAVGNHVEALQRTHIAGVALDTDLAPGESRALTQEEIEALR